MPQLSRAFAILFTVLASAAVAPATAQEQASQPPSATAAALDRLLGQTVVEVRLLVGERENRDADLRQVLETAPGAPLTAYGVRESIVHLMALARFENVTVDAAPAPGGVILEYRLTPLQTVKGIEFRGDLGLTAHELRAAVEERFGASPQAARTEEIAAMLESQLRDRGFLKAAVRPFTETADKPGRIRLVFEVTAGSPAKVGRAAVEGAPDGNAEEVLRRLDLKPGARFDRLVLESAVIRYVESLRTAGYLEARMEPDVAYSPDGERAEVTLRMRRGPSVSIAFRGDPLPDKRREQIVALLSEGALDEDVLENQQRSIEDELRARGYRDAAAPFTRESIDDRRLLVVYTVERGPQYKVAAVELTGNQQLSRVEIQQAQRVEPGQWFVEHKVEADATAIRELYLKQGFRQVEVTVSTVPQAGDPTQLVSRFAVVEGPRTTISGIQFVHVTALPMSVLQQLVGSRAGGPFNLAQVEADREAIQYQYQALGYQQATVSVPPGFDDDGRQFALRFDVDEGSRSLLDHVLVVGNARTKTSTIESALALEPGSPLSFVALAEAQRRVSALGLFRRVQLTPLERNTGNRRDLLVSVEEAPVNTIGYGGGLEGSLRLKTNAATGLPEEKLDLAPRGFFEIGRRNLWGKNRSASLFTRGAIRTSDQFNTDQAPPNQSTMEDTGAGFREYRVLATYREPRFLNLPVDVVVAAALDQAIRSTFDFNRRQVNVEASHRFSQGFTLAGRYLFGHTRLFNERIDPASQLNVDRVFPTVRLSAFAGSAILSTRDDAFEPTRGFLTAFDIMFAPRAIGSEVGFIKASWQGFAYRQVPKVRGVVFAGGMRVGLARGAQQIALDPDGRPVFINQELPASERYFAGGDTTVRGWALDRLGSESVLDPNGVSNGGNGLLIFNGELRFPFWRRKSIGGAVFIDVGNVFAKVGDIELGQLRSGAGFGIRWRSPVGPLRVDFAWKLHPITFANGQPENHFAWYVTIGQAF
jgi:outer membrane protein insertion porin family